MNTDTSLGNTIVAVIWTIAGLIVVGIYASTLNPFMLVVTVIWFVGLCALFVVMDRES